MRITKLLYARQYHRVITSTDDIDLTYIDVWGIGIRVPNLGKYWLLADSTTVLLTSDTPCTMKGLFIKDNKFHSQCPDDMDVKDYHIHCMSHMMAVRTVSKRIIIEQFDHQKCIAYIENGRLVGYQGLPKIGGNLTLQQVVW